MSDIIEQQGLLKGLTDQRLAMLMQQPDATIPPFLVAAEAQRRQAIRAQFSGGPEKNESVVDSLARQLARTPQNVNANPPAPPAPPPQQMGISGIQQPGMAGGGMVQRYDVGGEVGYAPTMMRVAPTTLPTIAANIPGIAAISDAVSWAGNSLSNAYTYMTTPTSAPDQAIADVEAEGYVDPFTAPQNQAIRSGKAVIPRNQNAGKENTSTTNVEAPAVDELRNQLKSFYADDGVTSWDRAQKWYAVSKGLLDPNATTGELIAGAITNFGQGMAEEKRMERQAAKDEAEALLKYDIGKADEERQTAAAALKARTDIATGQLDDLRRQQSDLAGRIRDIQKGIDNASITDVDAARKEQSALQAEINKNNNQIAAYQRFIGKTYGFNLLPQVNLQTGQIEYPEN